MSKEFNKYLTDNRIIQNSNKELFMTPQYAYGGELLPEYGFGSWLKNNAGGILKGAGNIAKPLWPPIGTIVGGVLDIAGAAVDGVKANKQAQSEADLQAQELAQEQKRLNEEADAQKQANYRADLGNRRSSFLQANEAITYGGVAALGGDMNGMLDTSVGNPMINEYSNKAYKHGEGPNGVPVDNKGNPSATSKQSAVGLTEGGEVTWNGYVFSDQIDFKNEKK